MNKKILIIMLCAIIGIVLYVNLSGDNSEPEEVSEDVKLLTESYKTELNKIAARWPAKAVVQLFFSIIK